MNAGKKGGDLIVSEKKKFHANIKDFFCKKLSNFHPAKKMEIENGSSEANSVHVKSQSWARTQIMQLVHPVTYLTTCSNGCKLQNYEIKHQLAHPKNSGT